MSKGTTPRAIRISDELWNAAKQATEEAGESVSEVIRLALTEYVTRHQTGDRQ